MNSRLRRERADVLTSRSDVDEIERIDNTRRRAKLLIAVLYGQATNLAIGNLALDQTVGSARSF
jgi:hypothetical protein